MSVLQKIPKALKNIVTTGTPRRKREPVEVELNKNLDLMISAGNHHLKQWLPIYRDGHDYLYNNQLVNQVRKDGWDRIQDNHIFPAAAQALSLLALQRPKFLAHPREAGDAEGAQLWEPALQWQFEEGLDVPGLRLDAKLDNQSHGHCVVKLWWEHEDTWLPEEMRWQGKLRRTLLDPELFVMDPDAEDGDVDKAEWAYYLREVPVVWAKQRWPEHADAIEKAAGEQEAKGDAFEDAIRTVNSPRMDEAVDYDSGSTTGEHGQPPQRGPEGRLANVLRNRQRTDRAKQHREGQERPGTVWLLDAYRRDYTKKKITHKTPIPFAELVESGRVQLSKNEQGVEIYMDNATGEVLTEENRPVDETEIEVPKYPWGRHTLRVGERAILEDHPWPLKKWPFVIGVDVHLPHTWHGLNAVEMARGLQDFKNIIWTNFSAYTRLHAQPRIKVKKGSLQGAANNEHISAEMSSRPGALIKTLDNAGIEVMDIPTMGSSIFQILEKCEEGLRDMTGMQNIAMGKKSPGEQTATEAIELQTNSKIRSALENMNMDAFTLQFMQKTYMFLEEYWEPGDIARVVGEQYQMIVNDQMLDAEFDLKMEVGTVLPFDIERERLKADRVLEVVGPAYTEEWLKAYEVKRADVWAAEANAWAVAQAEMEAMGSQPQQPAKKKAAPSAAVKPASVGGK